MWLRNVKGESSPGKLKTLQVQKQIFRDVAQMVARLLWEQDVAGSNPVIPTISSVHNGFELWTLDFLQFRVSSLCMEQVLKPALLFYADLVIYSTATPFRVSAL